MDHIIDGPPETVVESESYDDIVRVSITATLKPGEHLRIVKLIGYRW